MVPVGNAAAALEPIGGEGMGLAIASAHAAATAVIHDQPLATLDATYGRLWRGRRAVCRSAAMAMSHRPIDELTVLLARAVPPVARLGMRLAGKSDAGRLAGAIPVSKAACL